MPESIPKCFYRISVKALVLDQTRTKFLIIQEDNGKWELPGGGLDWEEKAADGIKREIQEEMGIEVTWVSQYPAYFLTILQRPTDDAYIANVLFETTLKDLNFHSSKECVALRFVTPAETRELDTFPNVQALANIFDPTRHK